MASWVDELRPEMLDELIGPRTRALALSGSRSYAILPSLRPDGWVVARLGSVLPSGRSGVLAEVAALVESHALRLRTACSLCSQAFGPCEHASTLAYDLACSPALRSALAGKGDIATAAAQAERDRAAHEAALRFEGALATWLPETPRTLRIEIAATPFDKQLPAGRGYGEAARATPIVTLNVREKGQRRLLVKRELEPFARLAPRDRDVLEHATERGLSRKALFLTGVEASIAIEAMRAHGRVFQEGFRALLAFPPELVRPRIALDESQPERGFEVLVAHWQPEGEAAAPISFHASAFFPGPRSHVWTEDGRVYAVAPDVDVAFATQLSRMPSLSVPRGRLHVAGSRLVRAARGRGVALPPNDVFGLPRVEMPRLVLRLTGDPLVVRAELLAMYPDATRPIPLAGAPRADTEGDVARDLETELRALAIVRAAGLSPGMDAGEDLDNEADSDASLTLAGERAIALWQTGLPAVREAFDPRIEIEASERLSRVRVGPPVKGRVHVALEGDWLETRVAFSADELPVEIAEVRRALAKKTRWLSLGDGTLARISSAVERLVEEADAVLGEGSERRLAPHQLGRIDRWIEETDGRVDASVEALRRRLRALAVAAEPEMPEGLRTELRPYQRLGLAWLQFLQGLGAGGLLADDMGLGKTVTTLAFLLARKEREGAAPTLVVCPTSVIGNWVREAARFTPDLTVSVRHGVSRDVRSAGEADGVHADVILTTYALLRRDVDVLRQVRFRCVVLDEAQNIKNEGSATARAAGQLEATMRLALSGTPVENRLAELWSLSSFANPGILGTARAFEKRYATPIATDPASPLAAELRAVVRPFLLRRTKADVLRELPAKTEIDRIVVLPRAAKRRYDALAHALREGVLRDLQKRDEGATSLSVFTALMRLRQMACDPRLVDPSAKVDESEKRRAFLEVVRELVAEGRRALVFSQFVELLTLWRRDLEEEGIAYEYLDGGTTRRELVVDRFQSGSAPLFLISLKAGGAGLNLTAADTVIHCDPWWNPAVEDQATDRAHRIGQTKPVTVVRLVAAGTIEEKILSLKAKKRALTRAVIGDDGRALEGLTEEDITLLLGEIGGADEDDETAGDSPRDLVATDDRILDDDFLVLVQRAQRWLETTGRTEHELSTLIGIPVQYGPRLRRGSPFPCSRAVLKTALARLRAW